MPSSDRAWKGELPDTRPLSCCSVSNVRLPCCRAREAARNRRALSGRKDDYTPHPGTRARMRRARRPACPLSPWRPGDPMRSAPGAPDLGPDGPGLALDVARGPAPGRRPATGQARGRGARPFLNQGAATLIKILTKGSTKVAAEIVNSKDGRRTEGDSSIRPSPFTAAARWPCRRPCPCATGTNCPSPTRRASPRCAAPSPNSPNSSHDYTWKSQVVAVVTDGSAVLGLGDIGPEASLPVMEGKAILFKQFGGVDAVPVALDCREMDEIVETVVRLAPSFGGVNLEDISAPRCFEIERKLKERAGHPGLPRRPARHGRRDARRAAQRREAQRTGRSASCARSSPGRARPASPSPRSSWRPASGTSSSATARASSPRTAMT